MFSFLYLLCFVITVIFNVVQWSKFRNKLIPLIGFALAFIPMVNVITAAMAIHMKWPQIKKLWADIFG